MGRWSEESKHATSVENILCSDLNIRSDRPAEIVLAFGEKPLPNECRINGIKLSGINMVSNKSIRILGHIKEHIKNITLNDITLNHKTGNALEIEYADNAVINGFNLL